MARSTNPPSDPETSSDRRKRVLVPLLLLAAIAILGLSIGLLYFVQEDQKKQAIIEELVLNKEELLTEIEDLNKKVQSIERELGQTRLDLDQKTENVEQLLRQIDFLQKQVKVVQMQGELLEGEKEKFEGMYEQLKYYNTRYQKQIAALKAENERLKEELAQATGEKKALAAAVENLENQVFEKDLKLESAKALTALSFEYFAIKRNRKAAEGKSIKRRDVQSGLEVCFTIPPNPNAPTGEQGLYLILTDPQGNTLKNFDQGSGYFTFSGRKLAYSVSHPITYQGKTLQECITYKLGNENELARGRYEVLVYTDQFLIGRDAFTLE